MTKALLLLLHLPFTPEVEGKYPSTQNKCPLATSWPRRQTSLSPGFDNQVFDNQLGFGEPSQQEYPCAAAEHWQSLPPAPAATPSPQTDTGSFSCRQHQRKEASSLPKLPHQPGWNHSWAMSRRKTDQETDLGFICCFACFVTRFVCFFFFPLIHIKFSDSGFWQHDWGEADTSITTEQ